MILVSNIEPVDLNSKYSKISDLEVDYMLLFYSNYKPSEVLKNKIDKLSHQVLSKSTKGQLRILEYLYKNFDKILLGTPHELNDIIWYFRKNGWQKIIYNGKKATKFGKSLLTIFGYSNYFRSLIKRGVWLAKQLNLKSCPYCNAQYTLLVQPEQGKAIAKFQFDHFFTKEMFPYLSISLYNLIPSCANCNLTKSKKQLSLGKHYHPYFSDFTLYAKFKLKYKPNPALLTISQVKNQNLEIDFVSKHRQSRQIVNDHNELYHIKGVYNRHQDIAEDLLTKAIIYTKHMQKNHLKIKGLFPDNATYLRYLIGTFPNKNDILKRPLTKFIQDLARQLKLIEK